MEHNPEDRYASAAEMKAELDAPSSVQISGRHERLRPPAVYRAGWRSFWIWTLVALVPVFVFGLLYLAYNHPWARK